MSNKDGWQIDRHIPIATVIVIGTQTVAAGWYAASMYERMNFLEHRLTAYEARTEALLEHQVILERLVDVMQARLEHAEQRLYDERGQL